MSESSRNPPGAKAVVLLSGGLDSVAALCWAQARYVELEAISFDYAQPNRNQEIPSAQRTAKARGVGWRVVHLSDALRPEHPAGIMGTIPDHDASRFGGTDKAFVPGRNVLFATVALAHASTWWPTGNIDIVMGACAEDQAGFHDCRPGNLAKLAEAFRACFGKSVVIRTPWAEMTKSQILYAVRPDVDSLELVRRSYSCYRDDGPCLRCSACIKRGAAFAEQAIQDLSQRTHMTGGDPHREVR